MRRGKTTIGIATLITVCCTVALAQKPSSSAPPKTLRPLPFVQRRTKPKVEIAAISLASLNGALEVDVNRSMKARRALAWSILEKIWTPVGTPGAEVPAWMTWYEQEDLEPLFRQMLAASPRPATPAQIASTVTAVMSRNSTKDLQKSLSAARLGKTLRQFTFPEFAALRLHTKPGTGSIFYNPAYVTHLLANAERIATYNPAAFKSARSGTPTVQPGLPGTIGATAANGYALSMDSEMPSDALMIKVDWAPVEKGAMPYLTDGQSLAKSFLASPTGTFDIATFPGSSKLFIYPIATPQRRDGSARLIVVSDEHGKKWALMAMHVASKVRRTWLWITMMWLAPRAPYWEADRPPFFTQYETDTEPWTTWPLHQYGMAVASDFREGDPAPWAPFDRVPEPNRIGPNSDLHDMATSLKDLAAAMNGLQWCANPFIEVGMSHTNCIGCHQGSPNEFLATTLTKARNTNVGDFSFSIASNREMFIRVLAELRR